MTNNQALTSDLSIEVIDQMIRFAAWVDFLLRETLRPENLTTAQFEILEFICHHESVDNSGLRESSCYEKSTLSRLLSKLAQANLVVMRKSGRADLRRQVIIATDQGRSVVDRVRSDLAKKVSGLLISMPVRARGSLTSGLRGLESKRAGTRLDVLAGFGGQWRYPRLFAPREAATKTTW